MRKKIKILLGVIALSTAIILIKSCAKNSSSSNTCSDCQRKADTIISAKFESSLSGLNLNTETYYTAVSKNECEIDLVNRVEKEKFAKISTALESVLGFHSAANEKTMAFTIYRQGGLHTDGSVLLKDIFGVSRYFLKENKLYHQLFIKASVGNQFSELKDLNSEVDGFVFNYMHLIGRVVLNLQSPASAFFLKSEEAKGLDEKLKNPNNDLKWELKIYIQKKRLHNSRATGGKGLNDLGIISLQAVEDELSNCGEPCTKNDGTICRSGDYPEPINAKCGPDYRKKCLASMIYSFIQANVDNTDSISLNNGHKGPLDSCLNLDALTIFRDSVLYISDFGFKYINYYYLLSDRLSDLIDLTTALQIAAVGYDVNNVINILMNPTTITTTVLLTSQLKSEIVDILNYLKNITSDSEAINDLNEIISDMNSLQGETVGGFRTVLNL